MCMLGCLYATVICYLNYLILKCSNINYTFGNVRKMQGFRNLIKEPLGSARSYCFDAPFSIFHKADHLPVYLLRSFQVVFFV